eukprot:1061205-Rhodomonas_salina.3
MSSLSTDNKYGTVRRPPVQLIQVPFHEIPMQKGPVQLVDRLPLLSASACAKRWQPDEECI